MTRLVTLDVSGSPEVTGPSGERRRGYTATTRITRKDFGLTWDKAVEAGPIVGDEIAVTLDVEATRAAAAGRTSS